MNDVSFYKEKLHFFTSKLSNQTRLLVVSKNRSLEEIKIYYDLGLRDFGENRVQELSEKAKALQESCPDLRWHMIGHLQSNKIKQLLSTPNLVAIHSVDDADLLEKILSWDLKINHRIGLFLQINTSKEEEKSGLETKEEVLHLLNSFQGKKHFFLQGLMTMGKIRTQDLKTEARNCFKLLNIFKIDCEKILNHSLESSMGMSQDFEIALEEKSNWIRIGSALFS